MKAGFDLSEIDVRDWEKLCEAFQIDKQATKTDKGWVWLARYNNGYNFVVTANNPLTGYYYHDRGGTDDMTLGYCGYIGIEGDSAFVADFFVAFKKLCAYFKDENFGERIYI